MNLPDPQECGYDRFVAEVTDFCLKLSLDSSFLQQLEAQQRDIRACYPLLFAEGIFEQEFPPATSHFLEELTLAGNFYYLHVLLCDRILDELGNKTDIGTVLLSNFACSKAVETLSNLFPRGSEFWQYFDKYEQECYGALLRERLRHRDRFSSYSLDEFMEIAAGQAAFAKAWLAALCLHARKMSLIEPLSRSHDLFHIAFQLGDDMHDWQKDYEAQRYTFVLSKVIESHGIEDEVNSLSRPEAELIGKMLYYSGASEMIFDMAVEYLDKSLEAVEGISCAPWKEVVDQTKRKFVANKQVIATTRRETLAKLELP